MTGAIEFDQGNLAQPPAIRHSSQGLLLSFGDFGDWTVTGRPLDLLTTAQFSCSVFGVLNLLMVARLLAASSRSRISLSTGLSPPAGCHLGPASGQVVPPFVHTLQQPARAPSS